MSVRIVPYVLCSLCAGFFVLASPSARADVPFVVVYDDGSLQDNPFRTNDNINDAMSVIFDLYRDTGSPMPEVMSVWSAFPLGISSMMTLYLPIGNDITGIGLETVYGGSDGTFPSRAAPLCCILLHNDVTDLESRSARHEAPLEGYAQYLFLLELSHIWGPAVQLPDENPGALIGFTFHWSFWLDTGGAPAGGNRWLDNGDGTFTTGPLLPSEVTFSPFDLYIMGLVEASEVPPMGMIEAPDAPDVRDPINGGTVSSSTFPWFSEEPLTVPGVWREVAIDEVLEANGDRDPPFGEAPTSMDLGVVLILPDTMEDDDEEALRRSFDELAQSLAPSYARATGDLGSLEVVTWTETSEEEPAVDAGLPDGDIAPDSGPDAGVGDADTGDPDADVSDDGDIDSGEADGAVRNAAGGGCAIVGAAPRDQSPVVRSLSALLDWLF